MLKWPISRLIAAAALLGYPGPAFAQSLEHQVDGLFAEFAHSSVPGCAIGLFDGDGTVLAKGYGAADLSRGAATAADTRFELTLTAHCTRDIDAAGRYPREQEFDS